MDTIYLDPNRYLTEHLSGASAELVGGSVLPDREAEVGHVHLQVGDIDLAEEFYVNILGFEQTLKMPGALFVSAGGYHHHMAMNVWNSQGAGPRAASLGLGDVRISLPDRTSLDAFVERLGSRDIDFHDDGAAVRVLDPWQTPVTVTAQA